MIRFQAVTLGRRTTWVVPPEVAERLRPLIPDAQPADAGSAADVVVQATSTGWRVDGPGQPTRTPATLEETLVAVEWYVAEARLAAVRDHLQLHAAGCVSNDGAIVAVGPSGRGKSSLALAWSLAGHPLLSDDTLIVAPDGRVHGLPRTAKLATTLAAELGVDVERTVGWETGNDEVWFDAASAGGWGHPAPVRRLAIVRWEPGATTSVRPLARVEALREVLVTRMVSGAAGAAAFAQAAAVVEGAETVAVCFGNARDAAARLADA